ncbi:MAG: flagellar hook protein FlgE [Pseudomonadota bacterium]
MSLFGSLFSGVSGLTAQSQSMSMISDNISNVSTTAYKGAVADFSSLVTTTANVSTFSPGGVNSNTNYEITRQGLIEPSTSPTDVAIVGDGFFVVSDLSDGTGDQLYTRAGSFKTDFLGNLRNSAGYYLQGWALDNNDEIIDVNQVQTVNIRLVNGTATATSRVEMGANLDATQAPYTGTPAYAAGALAEFEATDGASGIQPHFARNVQIFDAIGRPHNVFVAFLKNGTTSTWDVEIYADDSEVSGPTDTPAGPHLNGLLASGQITFDGEGGFLTNGITPVVSGTPGGPVDIDWLDSDGSADGQVEFDFGTIGETDGLSQFASAFNVVFVTQNGAEVGQLNGVSIDEDGFVIASFSNGEQQKLYKLPISNFFNPLALNPRSGNVYSETAASGTFNLREAGIGGAGKISPSSLEAANVDIADEFTKMIVTQRAYSANARIITTTDEMLDELIRISR